MEMITTAEPSNKTTNGSSPEAEEVNRQVPTTLSPTTEGSTVNMTLPPNVTVPECLRDSLTCGGCMKPLAPLSNDTYTPGEIDKLSLNQHIVNSFYSTNVLH